MRRVRLLYPGGRTYMVQVVDANTGILLDNVIAVDFHWAASDPRPQERAYLLLRVGNNDVREAVEVASLGPAISGSAWQPVPDPPHNPDAIQAFS